MRVRLNHSPTCRRGPFHTVLWLLHGLCSAFAGQGPTRRCRASRHHPDHPAALSNLNHAFSAQESLLDARPEPVEGLDQGVGAANPCDRRFEIRDLKDLRQASPANPYDRRFEIRDLRDLRQASAANPYDRRFGIRDLKSLRKVSQANHEIRDIRFEIWRSCRARRLPCRGRLRPCDGIRIGKCSAGPSRGTSSLDSGDWHPRK